MNRNKITSISLLMVMTMSLLITVVQGQFKSDRQKELENILMAPCCGGGTLAEHDDNQHTINMKMIMDALTSDPFDKPEILALVKDTYSNSGIYRMGFSPARQPLQEILKYSETAIHPDMTVDEIADYFAWIHDGSIRSMPKHSGIGHLAWKMPAALLILGALLIILIIRSYIHKPVTAHPIRTGSPESSDLEKRIEQEMKDLNL